MATYRTPGAYIEEGLTLSTSASLVDTAVPVFVGYTQLHDAHVASVTSDSPTYSGSGTVTIPVKVHTFKEFVDLFGGAAHSMTVAFTVGSGYEISYSPSPFTHNTTSTRRHFLYYSLQWYFANGGGPCYVSSIGVFSGNGPSAKNFARAFENSLGMPPLEMVQEPTLVVAPDLLGVSGTGSAAFDNYYGVAKLMLAHCAQIENRFLLLDVLSQPWNSSFDEWAEVKALFKAQIGTQNLSHGAAYGPLVETSIPFRLNKSRIVFNEQNTSGSFADGKTLEELEAEIASDANNQKAALLDFLNAAFYTELEKAFVLARDSANPILGPAAAMAGIVCETDRTRGIHKAPANMGLAQVKAPVERFSEAVLNDLNDPLDGKAVNVIRETSGRGAVVMGARTLDANSPANRFVSSRRTMLHIEANVRNITAGALLQPNVRTTWLRVKTTVEGYLNGLWRQGTLVGANPDQAYFVKVGVTESMSLSTAQMGILVVTVGVSLSRPAEFVIAQFSFKA